MIVTHILLSCPCLYDQDVYHIEEENTYKFMFNNAQIVLKSMSAKQLEQLRQKQKVKPKDAAKTPKQRAMVPQKGVGELEQDDNKFDHGKVDTKEDVGVLAMEITKQQGEHKIDLGKIKMKEDVDVTTIDQSEKSFKLDIPLVIDFIIPNEFNDTMRKKNSFFLVLPKVIEELVQVSSLKILILQHFKTRGRVSSNRRSMMESWKINMLLLCKFAYSRIIILGPHVKFY